MKPIHFGRYLKRDSFFHQFHPLLKFLLFLSIILLIGFRWDTKVLLYASVLFVFYMVMSRVSPLEIASVLKPFKWLLVITFVLQFMFTGEHFWSFNIERLWLAAKLTGRFTLLILFSALLTISTSPLDLVRVLHFVMKPFERFGVKRLSVSLSALIALRFLPILFRKTYRIFIRLKNEGSFQKKGVHIFKQLETFLISLFENVFRYVDRVTQFLDRGHDWEQVLVMNKVGKGELIIFIILLMGVCGGILV